MENSDYIIYVDESGDHGLESIDPDYPIFVLTLCIFKKADYLTTVVPAVQRFKFDWFGHDIVVLHEHTIRTQRAPFVFLKMGSKRDAFMAGLSGIMEQSPYTVITAVIHKERLKSRYIRPENPYQLALLFCLERAYEFLDVAGQTDRLTHVICEARSPRGGPARGKEDAQLELEFLRIIAGKHKLQSGEPMPCFELQFASKQVNSTGLQIADLLARPIGIKRLRPMQPNRAYDIIREKIWKGPKGTMPLYGLKVFPY